MSSLYNDPRLDIQMAKSERDRKVSMAETKVKTDKAIAKLEFERNKQNTDSDADVKRIQIERDYKLECSRADVMFYITDGMSESEKQERKVKQAKAKQAALQKRKEALASLNKEWSAKLQQHYEETDAKILNIEKKYQEDIKKIRENYERVQNKPKKATKSEIKEFEETLHYHSKKILHEFRNSRYNEKKRRKYEKKHYLIGYSTRAEEAKPNVLVLLWRRILIPVLGLVFAFSSITGIVWDFMFGLVNTVVCFFPKDNLYCTLLFVAFGLVFFAYFLQFIFRAGEKEEWMQKCLNVISTGIKKLAIAVCSVAIIEIFGIYGHSPISLLWTYLFVLVSAFTYYDKILFMAIRRMYGKFYEVLKKYESANLICNSYSAVAVLRKKSQRDGLNMFILLVLVTLVLVAFAMVAGKATVTVVRGILFLVPWAIGCFEALKRFVVGEKKKEV